MYSHLGPEDLPQGAGVGETEFPLEPDEQPPETEIQVPRLLQIHKYSAQIQVKKQTKYRKEKNTNIR